MMCLPADAIESFSLFAQDFSPTQRRHYSIGNDGQSVSVTINRATKNDEGTWECWELDGQGTVKQKAHVMKLVVASKITTTHPALSDGFATLFARR